MKLMDKGVSNWLFNTTFMERKNTGKLPNSGNDARDHAKIENMSYTVISCADDLKVNGPSLFFIYAHQYCIYYHHKHHNLH